MNTPTRIILIVAFAMNSAGCISAEIMGMQSSASTVQGQVLEQGSRNPIPDAIVAGKWLAIVDTLMPCVHVVTTTTDAQGRFQLPTWKGYAPSHMVSYKPGMVQQNLDRYVFLQEEFRGTKDRHFFRLEGIAVNRSCTGAGESRKNLYRLYAALAEEAQAIAETPEQKQRAASLSSIAGNLLVDESKPATYGSKGNRINIDPNDSYKKEDLLK